MILPINHLTFEGIISHFRLDQNAEDVFLNQLQGWPEGWTSKVLPAFIALALTDNPAPSLFDQT